jgi:16S rRNA (cytidine1402-2'-O)-methyltransferase
MGTLYLVATPIGNLEDMSPRAVRVLRETKLIAAEDTRHTGILLKRFEIQTPLTSYFAINDPGYELVRAALASGFDVRPVPGPSAPVAALSVSGLPTDAFTYLGYLPHKPSERRKFVAQIANLPHTLIFLESPHRIIDSLEDLLAGLGDRPVCVAREMTKLFEEYWRGSLSGALDYFKSREVRGEFTLVVGGQLAVISDQWPEEKLLDAIKDELKRGKSAKEISAELAEQSGWNKKEVYALINRTK